MSRAIRKLLILPMLMCAVVGAHAQSNSERSAILQGFQEDIAACSALTSALKTDREFLASFSNPYERAAHPFEKFLRESRYAATPPYQYILRHPQNFRIDLFMHGDPLAVSWVQDEGVFCAPTFARLHAIEAMGESAEAWEIRVFFLDKTLHNLEHPSDEGYGTVEFRHLETLVLQASAIYQGSQRGKFRSWLRNAAREVRDSKARIVDGSAGRSRAEQLAIIDGQVAFLRKVERAAVRRAR